MTRSEERPADTLGMPEDEMRRLAHKVADIVVDRLVSRETETAILAASPADLEARLGGELPLRALDVDDSLALLVDVALQHQQRGDHPRFFARVPGPSSFAAILGEWLATGFNTIAASWGGGSGPATLELVVIDWLRQLMGFPEGTEGVLVSGGSLGSLTAFLAARSVLGEGVVYLSDQTHSSLVRDLRQIGYAERHVRVIASDASDRLPIAQLEREIAADRAAGETPAMVVGTAGTTNTGAVDPLAAIADICLRENMWFHVDGAYGAPAALTEQGRKYLSGMERADSLVLDPHKWFFQPYDVGCLLVRRPGVLERCFDMNPEYLKDVQGEHSGEVDLRNRSLELTRRSRACKLWLSMRTYGLERFRAAIDTGIQLAEFTEQHLREDGRWDIVSPAQIGIVCFALKGGSGDDSERRARALSEDGFACVTSTSLHGRQVFRLCTINPLTTRHDITRTIERLAQER